MKKLFFCIIITLIVSIGISAEDNDRKYSIQASPIYYLVDLITFGMGDSIIIIDIEGQYRIKNLLNISLAFSYFLDGIHFKDYQIHLNPMIIYRPLKTGLKGFYIGFYPIIGLIHERTWDSDLYFSKEKYVYYADFGIGFSTGYKWISKNGFTLQLGGGIGRSWAIPKRERDVGWITSDGRLILENFDINFDFKIGYSF